MGEGIEYASVEVMRGVRDYVNRQVWLMVSNQVWKDYEEARDQVSVQVYWQAYNQIASRK
jgi:hypothetical protein